MAPESNTPKAGVTAVGNEVDVIGSTTSTRADIQNVLASGTNGVEFSHIVRAVSQRDGDVSLILIPVNRERDKDARSSRPRVPVAGSISVGNDVVSTHRVKDALDVLSRRRSLLSFPLRLSVRIPEQRSFDNAVDIA